MKISKLVYLLVIILSAGFFSASIAFDEPQTETRGSSEGESRAIEKLKQQIAGRENEPAAKVFKNIKVLSDVPAARLLGIMKIGYAKSLGVSCGFCHVAGEWESDEKEEKRIAREMVLMTREINLRVRGIPELADKEPAVNCTTCHRGEEKPALDLKED